MNLNFGDLSQAQEKKMMQIESLYILKDQERVKWINKWGKTHGPWGKARWGYHEFGRWEMAIME